jgi:hypothetical protein
VLAAKGLVDRVTAAFNSSGGAPHPAAEAAAVAAAPPAAAPAAAADEDVDAGGKAHWPFSRPVSPDAPVPVPAPAPVEAAAVAAAPTVATHKRHRAASSASAASAASSTRSHPGPGEQTEEEGAEGRGAKQRRRLSLFAPPAAGAAATLRARWGRGSRSASDASAPAASAVEVQVRRGVGCDVCYNHLSPRSRRPCHLSLPIFTHPPTHHHHRRHTCRRYQGAGDVAARPRGASLLTALRKRLGHLVAGARGALFHGSSKKGFGRGMHAAGAVMDSPGTLPSITPPRHAFVSSRGPLSCLAYCRGRVRPADLP